MAKNTKQVNEVGGKLASGERINKAADDAAGLAISENLRADIRSLNQAKRNASDAVSLVQTTEGGLVETSNMLIRLRELAVQGASDTIGDTERSYIDREFVQLKEEIDRIANSTEFNGIRLLAGKGAELPAELQSEEQGMPLEMQISKDYYPEADSASAESPINIIRINLEELNAHTHGENSLNLGQREEGTRVISRQSSQQSISTLDTAITKVNENRAYLGAIQNRFMSTINNLGVQIENLATSRSRIRDADFAAETAIFTQAKILQQAGASVLSQTNAAPQIVLSLVNNL
jgi:flagellin